MSLTVKELEEIQIAYPDYRIELVDGSIIIMSPSGYEPEEVGTEFARILGNWVRPRKLGRVVGSSAGFKLPNSDLRAPDVSFVRAERLKISTEDYAELVPDLVVEVKSKTDSIDKLREKIQEFIKLGSQVGILINPKTRTLEVSRDGETVILKDGDILTLPDLLPGFEVVISEIWPPVFE
ncbi:Uma2 family endonuclease [Sphaerospermopsis sp. LEGE 08334]|jgi:Uma2 family endonuclease|uniref:Uma2 family endonuclease n=1 Tax=Sphaerospermopsis sp. LEGE 08334 TaxID=1828651 RepID=UPI0018817B98|nr:Uma2 family endonuclease [Sphaerospermopsis sp. LEGE 08334]MBE9058184.1 Uma2 family endonuclease [Sphaerospermopsis sp. LEGE 08334]